MSFSEYFLPSTQDLLSAQMTPPKRQRRQDHSIIVISSSPIAAEDAELAEETLPRVFSTVGVPEKTVDVLSDREQERSIEVLNDEDFAILLHEYQYSKTTSPTLPTMTSTPKVTHKSNLTTYVPESKPKPLSKRVKPHLSTRIPLPQKPRLKSKPSSELSSADFFTSWAASQAPVLRAANHARKPRRKPTTKKTEEVVLLSPRTGQRCVRVPLDEIPRGMLGKGRGGNGMWGASSRGLEGELYDEEGGWVSSQEVRERRVGDMDRGSEGEMIGKEGGIEIVEVSCGTDAEIVVQDSEGEDEDVVSLHDHEPPKLTEEIQKSARRKVPLPSTSADGMPTYSKFTIPQLQVPTCPPQLTPVRSQTIRLQTLAIKTQHDLSPGTMLESAAHSVLPPSVAGRHRHFLPGAA
jgi:hypothetical protein